MILEIIFLNQKKDRYKPVKTGNAFSSNFIDIKVMNREIKHYRLKIIMMKLNHI